MPKQKNSSPEQHYSTNSNSLFKTIRENQNPDNLQLLEELDQLVKEQLEKYNIFFGRKDDLEKIVMNKSLDTQTRCAAHNELFGILNSFYDFEIIYFERLSDINKRLQNNINNLASDEAKTTNIP